MFKSLNNRVYIVGGAVRDHILGIKPTDIDYCIECTSEEYESVFPDHKRIDKSNEGKKQPPVYMYPGVGEVAITRKEISTGNGSNDFEYEEGCSIQEDLMRRDITINSIAMNYITKEIIDPCDGIDDLKNGIIRATNPKAFVEDPLRIYRAIRFASRFEFNIEPMTRRLIQNSKFNLQFMSMERVHIELHKLYKDCKAPSLFFKWLRIFDCLHIHFNELYNAINVTAGPIEYHPEEELFLHLVESFDRAKEYGYSFDVAIAALTHDYGKIDTPKEILPKHIGHELRDNRLLVFFHRHKFSHYTMKLSKCVHKNHMYIQYLTKIKKLHKLIQFVRSIRKDIRNDFISACNCDFTLTQEQWNIWDCAVKAVEETKIVLPDNIKAEAIPNYVDSKMVEAYKNLMKGK